MDVRPTQSSAAPAGDPDEVVVTSRHLLMAQVVAAGLQRFARPVRWVGWDAAPWRSPLARAAVLVVLDELDTRASVDALAEMIVGCPAPVLVLSGRPRGPTWGALLAAGAADVRSSDTSLDELEATITALGDGEELPRPEHAELIKQWDAWLDEESDLRARVQRLSPREASVLVLLADGRRVTDIGHELGVREGTVRSQVKSLRRKLRVDSQLGAVAVVHRLAGGLPDLAPGMVHAPPGGGGARR